MKGVTATPKIQPQRGRREQSETHIISLRASSSPGYHPFTLANNSNMVFTIQHLYEHAVGGLPSFGFARPFASKPKAVKKPSPFEDVKRLQKPEQRDEHQHRRKQQRASRVEEPTTSVATQQAPTNSLIPGFSLFTCAPDMNIDFFPESSDSRDSLFDNSLADEFEDMDMDIIQPQVSIKSEPLSDLLSCPRILTMPMIQQLLREALPQSLKTARWDRIYAVGRDGDTFYAMLNKCVGFKDTVIVAQTSQGYVLGGYASSPWEKSGHGRSYFGTGTSFLFASHPEAQPQLNNMMQQEEPKQDDQKPLSIFRWTGSNVYAQACDVEEGVLAMGGEGAFGLIVQDNFSRGCSGYCSTFGNPPLVPGGHFDVVSFEIYGFPSLGATTRSRPFSSSQCSFNRNQQLFC